MAEMIARDPHVRSVEKLATATSVMGTNAVTEWKLGDYEYDGSGNIKKIGDDVFVYDERSRLIRGDAGAGHKQDYTYDGFGNIRTIITDAPGPIATNQTSQYKTSVAVNPKTNRAEFPGTDTGNPNQIDPLTGQAYSMAAQYDATGNVIALQINDNDTFQYDGLGRVTKAKIDGAWRAYVYTASDERIGTIALASENGAETGSSWTIRDIEGKVLRRYSKSGSSWTWNEDYIYRGSQMLAAELPGSETKHFHLDHLGPPRLVTNSEGVEISRHAYYPFGYEAGAATSGEKQFTGHERDSPTLDYMHARYYGPSWGRFLSVDPGRDWDPRLPQSWNMYAYVRDNPVNATDPTGRNWLGNIVELGKKGFRIIRRRVGQDEMVEAVKAGNDVLAPTRNAARDVAKKAGAGRPPVHDAAHGAANDGFRPHYHVNGRPANFGHIFYGLIGFVPYIGAALDADASGPGEDPHVEARAQEMFGAHFYELDARERRAVFESLKPKPEEDAAADDKKEEEN